MIVDCAVYQDGRRQPGELSLADVPAACKRKNLRVDRPLRADGRGVRRRAARVRSPRAGRRGRDPRAPAPQARDLRRVGVRRAQDRALRRRDREVEPARSTSSSATSSYRGPPRRDQTCTTCVDGWRSGPTCCAAARRRRCTRSSTRSWTTTSRSSSASRTTSVRSSSRSSPGRREPGQAHLPAQARGPGAPPGDGRRSSSRSSTSPTSPTASSTTSSPSTSATSTTTLLRMAEPGPDFRTCLTNVLEANLTQVSVRRTRTCGRSRPGPRSASCRRSSRGSTG